MNKLLAPIKIGKMTLKNRVCMPAMHLNYTINGEIDQRILDFYARRAAGGLALITVGGCAVDQAGGMPMLLQVHHDKYNPGLFKLAAAIKDNGARACAQLYHAGRYSRSIFTGKPTVSASALPCSFSNETPHQLSIQEIEQLIQAFINAAKRVKKIGFDAVEIIASAGYLLCQFLSPITNQRDDQYGGSFQNRCRFPAQVVAGIREAVGKDYPLIVRMSGNDFVPGSNTLQEAAQIAKIYAQSGANAINVTGGWHESMIPQITMDVPRGAYLYLASKIRQKCGLPVMASNRINDPDLAEKAVARGLADMVNLGRPLIADPDFVEKTRQGKKSSIKPCIGCNQGCLDSVFSMQPVTCLVNPRAGREAEFSAVKASEAKKVVVAGGGPAGMQAAITCAERGHQVVLFESENMLGGQLKVAASTYSKRDWLRLIINLANQVYQLGVDVKLGQPADMDTILKQNPDAVILATGARQQPLAVPVQEGVRVEDSFTALTQEFDPGDKTVVIGGGAVGCEVAQKMAQVGTIGPETAYFLMQYEAETPEVIRELMLKGNSRVTLVEMGPKLAPDMGKSSRWITLKNLKRFSIQTLVNTQVLAVDKKGVRVQDKGGEERLLETNTVINCTGYVSHNPLASLLKGKVPRLEVIGDAQRCAKAIDAIRQGLEIGYEI